MPNLGNKPVAARKVAGIPNEDLPLVGHLQVALITQQHWGGHLELRNETSGQRDEPRTIRDTERMENAYPQRL